MRSRLAPWTPLAGGGIGYLLGSDELPLGGLALGVAGLLSLTVLVVRTAARSSGVPAAVGSIGPELGWREFYRELAGSRRHERPLTIVRLAGSPGELTFPEEWVASFGHTLRRLDRAWVQDGELYLLLPDTDQAAALKLIERIRPDHGEMAGVRCHVASWPSDGLTSGALLAALFGEPLPRLPEPYDRLSGVGSEVGELIELWPRESVHEGVADSRIVSGELR